MKVKQKYSFLSEQMMYEWSQLEPTRYNMGKRMYYAYWQSIKDLNVSELEFDDYVRIGKIEDMHMSQCKRPKFKR
jgi:hypothetical protein